MTSHDTNPDDAARKAAESALEAQALTLRARHGDLADEEATHLQELRNADPELAAESDAMEQFLSLYENARVEPSSGHRDRLRSRLTDLVREDVHAVEARRPGPFRRACTLLWGPVEGDAGRLILGRSLAVACGVLVAIVLFQVAGMGTDGLSDHERARIVEQVLGHGGR